MLAVYAAATQAISEFERGAEFHKFNSKYDYWLAGRTQLNPAELRGFTLFTNEAKANCSACHPAGARVDAGGRMTPPLFTDFTYDNIGLPRNLRIPGMPPPDPGLAGRADVAAGPAGADQRGKQKVMTLRNIAVTPPYGHNGVLETLEQVVHFYNTRDTLGRVESNLADGFGLDGWPAPEVDQGVNAEELGHLGLSPSEESDIVAFLNTLTDDYPESGKDPNVPPGTPSPFPYATPPPIPVRLTIDSPGQVRLFGRLGKSYRLEATDVLGRPDNWSPLGSLRLGTNGSPLHVPPPATALPRFFRAVEAP